MKWSISDKDGNVLKSFEGSGSPQEGAEVDQQEVGEEAHEDAGTE